MESYRREFGRVQRFLIDVALDLHLLALDAHQVDYWMDAGDVEQTLCALERCKARAGNVRKACSDLIAAQVVIEPPAKPSTSTG